MVCHLKEKESIWKKVKNFDPIGWSIEKLQQIPINDPVILIGIFIIVMYILLGMIIGLPIYLKWTKKNQQFIAGFLYI